MQLTYFDEFSKAYLNQRLYSSLTFLFLLMTNQQNDKIVLFLIFLPDGAHRYDSQNH